MASLYATSPPEHFARQIHHLQTSLGGSKVSRRCGVAMKRLQGMWCQYWPKMAQ